MRVLRNFKRWLNIQPVRDKQKQEKEGEYYSECLNRSKNNNNNNKHKGEERMYSAVSSNELVNETVYL